MKALTAVMEDSAEWVAVNSLLGRLESTLVNHSIRSTQRSSTPREFASELCSLRTPAVASEQTEPHLAGLDKLLTSLGWVSLRRSERGSVTTRPAYGEAMALDRTRTLIYRLHKTVM